MNILLTADSHVHVWKSSSIDRSTMLSKQLMVQDDILNRQIYDLIKERRAGLFLHGGDWFQEVGKIPVECLNIVDRFLKRIRAAGVRDESATGNHDLVKRINPEWYHNIINLFRDLPDSLHGNKQSIIEIDGIKIGFINFEDEVDYDKYAGLDIVIAHKTPVGAAQGDFKFDEGVDWKRLADNNRLVFFAHIHQNQQMGDNCYIIGAPMHFNFGDIGDRGVYVIDTDIWSVEFVKLEYPEFRTVDFIEQVTDDYNYYRVLHAENKSDHRDNAVIINEPRVFKERIKSEEIHDVAVEWLKLNGKDERYIDLITDDLGKVEQRKNDVKPYKLAVVTISNFLSVGEISYNLDNGFTLIGGQSEHFSSNGSGKTAVVDAIYWALFGKTTKGLTGDEVIRRGEKDCSVKLELSGSSHELVITRTRKEGLVVEEWLGRKLIKEHTEGFKQQERQLMLERLLGFGESLYMSSCYFSQESLAMLTEMTDVDRTNMITELLGFNSYDTLYTVVTDHIKEETKLSEEMEVRKVNLNNQKENCRSKISMLDRVIQGDKDSIVECEKLIAKCKVNMANVKPAPLSGEIITGDFDVDLAELATGEENLKKEQANTDIEIGKMRDDIGVLQSKIIKFNTNSSMLKVEVRKIEGQIENLKGVVLSERCDKCGALATAKNRDEFIKEKNEQIAKITAEWEELSTELMVISNKERSVKEKMQKLLEKRNGQAESLERVSKDIKDTNNLKFRQSEQQRLEDKEKDRVEAEKKQFMSLITTYHNQIIGYDKKIKDNEIETDKYHLDIDGADEALETLDISMSDIARDLEGYEVWKVAFSPKGIKSLLLDKFCNDINVIVNNCLSVISNGAMAVTITPTSVIKTGEERNKLGIEIELNYNIVQYESLSGGEKRRVDFALCIALNIYITNKFSLSSGLLGFTVMDELFSSIDKSGEELMGQYLQGMSMNRSILVITHGDELILYANRIWTVIKEDNVSRIEVG